MTRRPPAPVTRGATPAPAPAVVDAEAERAADRARALLPGRERAGASAAFRAVATAPGGASPSSPQSRPAPGRLRRLAHRPRPPQPRSLRRPRRALPLVAGLLGALAVLGVLAWALLASPLTALERVTVTGTRHTPAAAVRAAAADQLGRPLLRVRTSAVAASVDRLPWVRDAVVHRSFPRTLRVVVTERVPVAAVAAPAPTSGSTTGSTGGSTGGSTAGSTAGPFDLVDAGGRTIVRTATAPPGVPVVSVGPQAGRAAVRAASEVTRSLPPALRADVAEVTALSGEDVRLVLRGGQVVRWGSPASSGLKARELTALRGRHADAYDVSAPDAPATS